MRSFWGLLVGATVYLAVALLCIRQWNSPHPWARLDVPVVLFFFLAVPITVHVAYIARILPPEGLKRFTGVHFDPLTEKLGGLLALLELSVFLEYGQWTLVPALGQPWLRYPGVLLIFAAAGAWLWVDRYFVRLFRGDCSQPRLVREGPFRILRHPRYSAILAYKLGVALVFASALGWIFTAAWAGLLMRRIGLEEKRLTELFGDQYRRYSSRTKRLLPGIY